MYKIPFSGRSILYNQKEIELVADSLNKVRTLTQGDNLIKFENKFAEYLNVKNVFAVNSATSALEIAAQLCQFENDEEVICPAHTYTSSVYPFIKHGGNVKWCDIDIQTRVITLDNIKKVVTKKTKAVVYVHLYGYMSEEIKEIKKFCNDKNIILIEDVAQAIGTKDSEDKYAGSYGDLSVFSFHSHKNITTMGEGGALIVNNDLFQPIISMLRHNGHCNWDFERDNYWLPAMGNLDLPSLNGKYVLPNNYCLGEIECALGTLLLDRLDSINDKKRERAINFIDNLSGNSLLNFHRVNSSNHNYHLLVATVNNDKRNQFIDIMSSNFGIQCVVQYYPLYRYDFYKKLNLGESSCPNTDYFFDNMVSFPFNHHITNTDIEYMLDCTMLTIKQLEK